MATVALAERPPLRTRVTLLDTLRGAALINMIAYHAVYDWVYVFGRAAAWYTRTSNAYFWQQAICWTFILLSGAVLPYARNAVKHGLTVFGGGMLLTAATLPVIPEQGIVFGILHFMGLALLLTAPLLNMLLRVPPWAGAAGCFVLFLFLKGVPFGFVGVGDTPLLALPHAFYGTKFLFWLGFPGEGFFSADYFPLLPWLLLFWTGLFLWRALQPRLEEKAARVPAVPVATALGRRSLVIYLVHQPLALAAVFLLTKVFPA